MPQLNQVTDYQVEDGVAVVTIDSPPVNALGHAVRLGIAEGIERFLNDADAVAMVLICAGRTFFAGADIREFGKPLASPVLREIAVQMEAANKPIIAAIHGTALGGGLEIALACHWRIAEQSARLGLPEVKLGLLAGAGGTQRLPRLIGAEKALDMVVSGDPIGAQEAFDLGLIDALAVSNLRTEALAFARSVAERPDALPRVRDRAVPPVPVALFSGYRERHAAALRGFEAPDASIRCIEAAVSQTFDEGLVTERALFDGLMAGSQCAAQRHIFFAEREAARVPGTSSSATQIGEILAVGALDGAVPLLERMERARIGVTRDSPLAWQARASQSAPVVEFLPVASPRDPVRARLRVSRAKADHIDLRIAPSGRDASLVELLRGSDTSDEAVASALFLGKRLGCACVVTLSGPVTIGDAMTQARDAAWSRVVADGSDPRALAAAAIGFGLTPATPDGDDGAASGSALLAPIILAQINAGAQLVESGAAARASDVDVACVKGGMWKAFRGGPMFHADQLGLRAVTAGLRELEHLWGEAFRPSALLIRLSAEGTPLHKFAGAMDA